MGGYGSSRWGWHSKKTTVEECRTLSIRDLVRFAGLKPNAQLFNGIAWVDSRTGEKTSSIGVVINTGDHQGTARLFYTFTTGARKGEKVDYHVILVSTRPYLGGLRWWFLCPAEGCLRQVAKLYLPPGARYFCCRHCYDLTYQSSQEHDKSTDWLRKLSPDQLLEVLRGGDTRNMLKAATVILERSGRW